MLLYGIELFHKGSKGESAGGKTNELLYNALWWINTGMVTHSYVYALNTTKDQLLGDFEGGTQYKRPNMDVLPTLVAKSASWYINDPLCYAKFGIWMGQFFKIFPQKFQKNQVISVKIRLKIGLIGMWIGHFFLENWYMYGSTFKFPAACPYQNQPLITPPPQLIAPLRTLHGNFPSNLWGNSTVTARRPCVHELLLYINFTFVFSQSPYDNEGVKGEMTQLRYLPP